LRNKSGLVLPIDWGEDYLCPIYKCGDRIFMSEKYLAILRVLENKSRLIQNGGKIEARIADPSFRIVEEGLISSISEAEKVITTFVSFRLLIKLHAVDRDGQIIVTYRLRSDLIVATIAQAEIFAIPDKDKPWVPQRITLLVRKAINSRDGSELQQAEDLAQLHKQAQAQQLARIIARILLEQQSSR
ncbi:MAG: hypothetical protein ABII72_03295, partial [Parcubacteria group bacterium]